MAGSGRPALLLLLLLPLLLLPLLLHLPAGEEAAAQTPYRPAIMGGAVSIVSVDTDAPQRALHVADRGTHLVFTFSAVNTLGYGVECGNKGTLILSGLRGPTAAGIPATPRGTTSDLYLSTNPDYLVTGRGPGMNATVGGHAASPWLGALGSSGQTSAAVGGAITNRVNTQYAQLTGPTTGDAVALIAAPQGAIFDIIDVGSDGDGALQYQKRVVAGLTLAPGTHVMYVDKEAVRAWIAAQYPARPSELDTGLALTWRNWDGRPVAVFPYHAPNHVLPDLNAYVVDPALPPLVGEARGQPLTALTLKNQDAVVFEYDSGATLLPDSDWLRYITMQAATAGIVNRPLNYMVGDLVADPVLLRDGLSMFVSPDVGPTTIISGSGGRDAVQVAAAKQDGYYAAMYAVNRDAATSARWSYVADRFYPLVPTGYEVTTAANQVAVPGYYFSNVASGDPVVCRGVIWPAGAAQYYTDAVRFEPEYDCRPGKPSDDSLPAVFGRYARLHGMDFDHFSRNYCETSTDQKRLLGLSGARDMGRVLDQRADIPVTVTGDGQVLLPSSGLISAGPGDDLLNTSSIVLPEVTGPRGLGGGLVAFELTDRAQIGSKTYHARDGLKFLHVYTFGGGNTVVLNDGVKKCTATGSGGSPVGVLGETGLGDRLPTKFRSLYANADDGSPVLFDPGESIEVVCPATIVDGNNKQIGTMSTHVVLPVQDGFAYPTAPNYRQVMAWLVDGDALGLGLSDPAGFMGLGLVAVLGMLTAMVGFSRGHVSSAVVIYIALVGGFMVFEVIAIHEGVITIILFVGILGVLGLRGRR